MKMSIEKIKKEHEQIEREIVELETIMEDDQINYPNLIHVFRKLHNFWNSHESREEVFFEDIFEKNSKFPVDKIAFEHKELNGYARAIHDAIKSGDEAEIKVSLDTDGKMLLDKLKKHMEFEEILFDKLIIKNE